ncbi:MAG: hypothetical protein ABR499_05555 [Gemmatimonadaceae bacterium]
MQFIRVGLAAALALFALVMPARAQRQPPPAQSPLAEYPGFGHDHQADTARFQRQEAAREQAIARCMQRSGFEYTSMPAVVNPRIPRAREALPTRQHPKARYVASLGPAERTRYNLTLYGVPDPNDEENLWDPRSPTGGGCWGEAMREIASVYAANSELMAPYLAMVRSVAQDARVQAAERRWAECMRARGYQYASPLALHSEVDRAAVQGPPPGRTMAEVQQRNQEARAAARECNSSAGLDSTMKSVRAEKEGEFVRDHKDVLDRHRERQRSQILPPE